MKSYLPYRKIAGRFAMLMAASVIGGSAFAEAKSAAIKAKKNKDAKATIIETFELLDINANGEVVAEEFYIHVKEVSFKQLDANGNGSISLAEWQVEEAGEIGAELFQRMDKNTDGKVSLAEFKNTPRMKEILHNLFHTLDRNGDKKLHKEELLDDDDS